MDNKKQSNRKEIWIGTGLLLLAILLLMGWWVQGQRREVYETALQQKEKERQEIPAGKAEFQVLDEDNILEEITGTDLEFAKKMITEYVTREGIEAGQGVCKTWEPLSDTVTNIEVYLDDEEETVLTLQYDRDKGAVTVWEQMTRED